METLPLFAFASLFRACASPKPDAGSGAEPPTRAAVAVRIGTYDTHSISTSSRPVRITDRGSAT